MVKAEIEDEKQDEQDVKDALWKGRCQGGVVGVVIGFIGGLIVK